jgi:hypothetical protein
MVGSLLGVHRSLLPLPLGEGWGEGKPGKSFIGNVKHRRFPLTLALSRRERE